MSKVNKKYLIILLALIIIGSGAFYWPRGRVQGENLGKIKADYPQYVTFVDDIEKLLNKKVEDKDRVIYYLDLGLAWKSLADRTQNLEHYQKALDVYNAGIDFTQRKNTILINNAGNMSIYLKDYDKARQYYEESIRLSPGDADGYLRLTDLHRNYLRSESATIIAIYDQGIAKMPDPTILFTKKQQYVKELGLDKAK